MLLRASSKDGGSEATIRALTSEAGSGSGVPHSDLLIHLVDAALGAGPSALEGARRAVVAELGIEALIDAAGIIATFSMQNRLTDATGMPLDTPIELGSRRLRQQLGVERFSAAQYTSSGGRLHGFFARIAEPVMPALFRLIGRVIKLRG